MTIVHAMQQWPDGNYVAEIAAFTSSSDIFVLPAA